MTSIGPTPTVERWGQHPTRSATGYTHLCACPRCGRLSLRDPDGRSQRAEALRIARAEEHAALATFRATRSKLPRVECRVCGVAIGVFSLLEEYLDRETDALIGLVARYERLGGRNVCFELYRADAHDASLVAPIGHMRDVKRLLCWLVSHPLPTIGKIEPQPSHDLLDEVIRLDQLSQPSALPADAVRMQRYEGLYRLQPHPLWDQPLHLVAVVSDEIGSDPTVASVFAHIQAIIPALLRRHLTSHTDGVD